MMFNHATTTGKTICDDPRRDERQCERERQVMFVLQIKWVIFFVEIVVDKNRCETTD